MRGLPPYLLLLLAECCLALHRDSTIFPRPQLRGLDFGDVSVTSSREGGGGGGGGGEARAGSWRRSSSGGPQPGGQALLGMVGRLRGVIPGSEDEGVFACDEVAAVMHAMVWAKDTDREFVCVRPHAMRGGGSTDKEDRGMTDKGKKTRRVGPWRRPLSEDVPSRLAARKVPPAQVLSLSFPLLPSLPPAARFSPSPFFPPPPPSFVCPLVFLLGPS